MIVYSQAYMLFCRLSRCSQAYFQACVQVCSQLHDMIYFQPTWLYASKFTLKRQDTPNFTWLYAPIYTSWYLIERLEDFQGLHQEPGGRSWVVGSGGHIVEEIITSINIKMWTISLLCPPQWDVAMPHSYGIDNHNYRLGRKSRNWILELRCSSKICCLQPTDCRCMCVHSVQGQ